jgi:hypothetical protein
MGGAGIYEIRRKRVFLIQEGDLIRPDTVPGILQVTIITEFVRQPSAYIDIPEPD